MKYFTVGDAQKELSRIKHLDDLIWLINEDLAATEAEMEGLKSKPISDMPRGGTPLTLPDYINRAEELRSKYADTVDEYYDSKNVCTERIFKITDEFYRKLLMMRYIKYKPWAEITQILNYSASYVYQIHRKALQAYAQVMMDETQ